MKVLFFQDYFQPFLGVGSLAAVLSREGHQCQVLIGCMERDLLAKAVRLNPDVACFSCMTPGIGRAIETALALKKRIKTTTLFGGIHPTLCPEIIAEPGVDVVCRGEGELALLSLVQTLAKGKEPAGIKNLWIKKPEGIEKNEIGPLVSDLDTLPAPDRRMYFTRYKSLANLRSKAVMAGRGCPFPCSFCANHSLRGLYRGLGKYVRLRSPGNVIDELRALKAATPLAHVYFNDDTFALDIEWLREFLGGYRKQVGLPFTCGTRADLVTGELVSLLASAGAACVEMGVESGDENIRRNLFKKDVSNQQLIDAARLIKAAGIRLKTSNILGAPGETPEMAFQTLAINRRMKADFVNCSLLQPYPGLSITEKAGEMGLLPEGYDFSLRGMSYRTSPLLSGRPELANLQKFFWLVHKVPAIGGLVKRAIRFSPNPVFDAVFAGSYLLNYKGYHGLSFQEVIALAIKAKSFF